MNFKRIYTEPKEHLEKVFSNVQRAVKLPEARSVEEMGKQAPDEEKEGLFNPREGELNMYYGVIGGGKTYNATADVWELLAMGMVVYTTWPIKIPNYDERKTFFWLCMGLLGFKKRFFDIPRQDNLHYIDVEKGEVDGILTFNPLRPSEYIAYLNTLNHCHIFIDEAWRVFDSYKGTDTSLDTRNLALVTRHKFRTINVIAQRPTSVQVTIRGNINRYYRCVKTASWPTPRFARYEFQEMAGETVNEAVEPLSEKHYWGRKKIFDSYNSYFYGDLDPIHGLKFDIWILTYKERIVAFWLYIKPLFRVIPNFIEKMKLTKPQNTTKIKSNLPF